MSQYWRPGAVPLGVVATDAAGFGGADFEGVGAAFLAGFLTTYMIFHQSQFHVLRNELRERSRLSVRDLRKPIQGTRDQYLDGSNWNSLHAQVGDVRAVERKGKRPRPKG